MAIASMMAPAAVMTASSRGHAAPCLLVADCSDTKVDSLLDVLDREIDGRMAYERAKRERLTRLYDRLRMADDAQARRTVLDSLFDEYRNYNLDTALIVAGRQRRLALESGDRHGVISADLNRAEAYKGLADYHRALQVLDSVSSEILDTEQRRRLFSRYCSVYLSLYGQTSAEADADRYRTLVADSRDSIRSLYEPGTWNHVINLAENYKLAGDAAHALVIYEKYLSTHMTDDVDMAVMSHLLAETYAMLGKTLQAKYHYTVSAILDIRSCTKKYMSLQELAFILNSEGDIRRAYRYISTSLDDVTCSSARSRLEQVARILPVIHNANNEFLRREAATRTWFYILVGALGVIFVVMLVLLKVSNGRIERQRARLAEANSGLRAASEQLEALNARRRDLNARLEESNRIKEAYIGDLFKLCSEYMEGMAKYRQSLRRMLKVGRTDEMSAMLAKPVSIESMKEFLHKFDAIFLDIFPDFIERFNSLLVPEARITPPKGELLTPELRIYALVRLGINDSTRIAAFLNYSTQTVYNYRQRMRDSAVVPKREFAGRVAWL